MAISNVPANVATSAMQAIPFSSMIGGPLKACIEAQAMAAKTSWEFIKEVGLNTDEKGQKSAVMVAFSFNKGGRMTQLNVPLLTIVPIPYIAINSVDINFKANCQRELLAHRVWWRSGCEGKTQSWSVLSGGKSEGQLFYEEGLKGNRRVEVFLVFVHEIFRAFSIFSNAEFHLIIWITLAR